MNYLKLFTSQILFSPLYKGPHAKVLKTQADPHNLFTYANKRCHSDTESFRRHAYLSWGLSTELEGIEKQSREDKIHLNYNNSTPAWKSTKKQEALVTSYDLIT